jgi:hypothetical protein
MRSVQEYLATPSYLNNQLFLDMAMVQCPFTIEDILPGYNTWDLYSSDRNHESSAQEYLATPAYLNHQPLIDMVLVLLILMTWLGYKALEERSLNL